MQDNKTEVLRPIYNKRTQTLYMPFEKKLLKVMKANVEQVVEFMSSLPRDRMQIRVTNPNEWRENETLTITGKNIIYTCKVASVNKNRKIIIKQIAEEDTSKVDNPLTSEEIEVIKEL